MLETKGGFVALLELLLRPGCEELGAVGKAGMPVSLYTYFCQNL